MEPVAEYDQCVRVIDQKISDFLVTLDLGLQWIGDAGKKLAAMVDTNPDAFDDILEASTSPWLTKDVLVTIEAIGRGMIAPELLMLPMHVLNRLAVLPTSEQIKAMQGVEVAVPPRNGKGKWHGTHKPACKLTPREAQRAIGPDGIRSLEEQTGLLARHRPPSLGKYQLILMNGCEPKIERVPSDSKLSDYQKQRVKVTNGCALIELYL
jgi:hypothetical protein